MHLDLAEARQARLEKIARRAAFRAKRSWQAGMRDDFDAGWQGIAAAVVTDVTAGQVAAATGASPYLASTARADGKTAPDDSVVQPVAFAGVDNSGRTLDGLLYGAVIAAKTAVQAGQGLQAALTAGATYLTVMTRTAVMDTGRASDLTAMTARSYTHWVRVVSPGACSRCAILAGTSSAQHAFKRHPGCRCTAAPQDDPDLPAGRYTNPTDYFDSLLAPEQERVFTKAGAEAIRAGADPISVVTARRGAPGIDYGQRSPTSANSGRRLQRTVIGRRPDGTEILGYTTGEGTTVRGAYGMRQRIAGAGTQRVGTRYSTVKRARLMPETIVQLTDDVELRRVLLRDAGYLDVPVSRAEMSAPLGGGYHARRADVIRADREIADAFYRSHGITLS